MEFTALYCHLVLLHRGSTALRTITLFPPNEDYLGEQNYLQKEKKLPLFLEFPPFSPEIYFYVDSLLVRIVKTHPKKQNKVGCFFSAVLTLRSLNYGEIARGAI